MTATLEAPVRHGQADRPLAQGAAIPRKAGWFTRITLSVLVFLWLVPLLGLLVTSFRSTDDQAEGGWWQIFTDPAKHRPAHPRQLPNAIEGRNLGEAFVNSLAIALPATFIPLLIAAFAAYAFTFMQFPGRDTLFITVVTCSSSRTSSRSCRS